MVIRITYTLDDRGRLAISRAMGGRKKPATREQCVKFLTPFVAAGVGDALRNLQRFEANSDPRHRKGRP